MKISVKRKYLTIKKILIKFYDPINETEYVLNRIKIKNAFGNGIFISLRKNKKFIFFWIMGNVYLTDKIQQIKLSLDKKLDEYEIKSINNKGLIKIKIRNYRSLIL